MEMAIVKSGVHLLDPPMWPQTGVWVEVRYTPLATAGICLSKDYSHEEQFWKNGVMKRYTYKLNTATKTLVFTFFLILLINPFSKIRRSEINGLKGMTHLIITEMIYQFSFPKLP